MKYCEHKGCHDERLAKEACVCLLLYGAILCKVDQQPQRDQPDMPTKRKTKSRARKMKQQNITSIPCLSLAEDKALQANKTLRDSITYNGRRYAKRQKR